MGVASASHDQEVAFNLTMNVHDMADWSDTIAPLRKKLEEEWKIDSNVVNYQAHVTDFLEIANEKVWSLEYFKLIVPSY